MTCIFPPPPPMNSSGANFSDLFSVWKCAINISFDNCANVFGIFNNSRESFLLFLWCGLFSFSLFFPHLLSKAVSVEVELSVLRFGKKLFDVSLELDYSSETYMSYFGIFPF